MSKTNCPACGSNRSDKINYANKNDCRDKTNGSLWINFETPYSPHYICMDCGQVFGGKNIYFTEKTNFIKSFKFYMGSMFGVSHYVMIDAKNMKVDYTCSQSGLIFDFSERKRRNNKKLQAHTWYKKILWTKEKWKGFLNSLEKCNIDCWARTYRNESLSDGMQWQVKIVISKNHTIESYGYNQFPPAWKKFIKVLQKYISKKIELPV